MGRETSCECRVGSEAATAKVLLESHALILRGGLRRQWPLNTLQAVAVRGDALCFKAGDESVALELGAEEAARWATRIAAPPKSLADKLGVSAAAPAFVYGRVDDEALAQALSGARTEDPNAAALLVAVVRSIAELDAAIALHATLPCKLVWMVHAKGPKALPSDAQVRAAMYARGWRDSKTSAVSATLTATRYGKPADPI